MDTWPNHRFFAAALLALAAIAAIWAGVEALNAGWLGAAAISLVAVTAVAAHRLRGRLPAFLGLLLVVAALVNAAGYVLGLWREDTVFDEVVHFYTSFAGLAAIGWLALRDRWSRTGRTRFVAMIGGAGLALGMGWEAFEWLSGMIGSPRDTAIDLLMDTVGAVVAGMMIGRMPRR